MEAQPTNSARSPDGASFADADGLAIRNPTTGKWEPLASLPARRPAPSDRFEGTSIIDRLDAELGRLRDEIKACTAKEDARCSELIDAIVGKLDSLNLSYQRITFSALEDCDREKVTDRLLHALKSDSPVLLSAILKSVGFLNRASGCLLQEWIADQIIPFLLHSNSDVREGAVYALRVLSTRSSLQALFACLEKSEMFSERFVHQEIAFGQNPEALALFLEWYRTPDGKVDPTSLPAPVALLLTSAWVYAHLFEEGIPELAARFGFIDRHVAALLKDERAMTDCREILAGIGICTDSLLSEYQKCDSAVRIALLERWCNRRQDFLRYLTLPEDSATKHTVKPVLIDDTSAGQIDRDLLLAALRTNDRANVELRCQLNPFDSKNETQLPGRFFYIGPETFRRLYFDSYIDRIRAVLPEFPPEIPQSMIDECIGCGVTELARADSETRDNEWKAQSDEAVARTIAQAVLLKDSGRPDSFSFMEKQYSRFAVLSPSLLRRAQEILSASLPNLALRSLSRGSRGVIAFELYRALAQNPSNEAQALHAWRLTMAEIYRGEMSPSTLPTIGIEVQSTSIPEELGYGWKAAFVYLGIPSPYRPDFPGVTEASFLPVRCARTLEIGLRGLRAFAFCPPSPLALHISIGADLGEEAKYLALPLLLNNRAPLHRADIPERMRVGLRNLLSKGLVNRDTNCIPLLAGETAPPFRTEIRVSGISMANHFSAEELDPEKRLLSSVQTLAAHCVAYAKRDPTGESAKIWDTYRNRIIELSRRNDFLNVLVSQSWTQSTGSTGHLCLLDQLPIVDPYIAFQQWSLKNLKEREELASAACEIFMQTVR